MQLIVSITLLKTCNINNGNNNDKSNVVFTHNSKFSPLIYNNLPGIQRINEFKLTNVSDFYYSDRNL